MINVQTSLKLRRIIHACYKTIHAQPPTLVITFQSA